MVAVQIYGETANNLCESHGFHELSEGCISTECLQSLLINVVIILVDDEIKVLRTSEGNFLQVVVRLTIHNMNLL